MKIKVQTFSLSSFNPDHDYHDERIKVTFGRAKLVIRTSKGGARENRTPEAWVTNLALGPPINSPLVIHPWRY